MADPNFDVRAADLWFAKALNNQAWDVIEDGARSDDDVERLLHAAHASCYHWLQVGTPLNHLRALYLVATAHATAGDAHGALRYANQCVELGERLGDEPTQFDRACIYGCAAQAYASLENADAARYRQLRDDAVANLDDQERTLIAKLYAE